MCEDCLAGVVPPFVLVPGFDGTGELFAPFIRALGPGYDFRVVRYSDERSLAECVRTAGSFITDEPVVLIAESFSGPVALSLMTRFPERIQAAVLCATFAATPHPLLLKCASRLPAALLGQSSLRVAAVRMFCMNGMQDSELLEQVSRVVQGMTPARIRARLRILREIDLTSEIGSVRVPTLYLRATWDRLIGHASGDQIFRQLPNAMLREVAGPHLLLQSRPAECAALVRDFVRNCTKSEEMA